MSTHHTPTKPSSRDTGGPIHEWFSLTYCNYQVLPRTLMQSMPIEWQERMVACLNEMQDAFQHVPQAEVYDVHAATEHIVNEMTDAELEQAGIEADWYRGEHPLPWLSADELDEWRAKRKTDAPRYYRDGQELDPGERVLIPAVDPVPHYNRGRTYIEPYAGTSE
ncbi:hypothetical protein ABT357_24975 [Streptomyces albidoflavus]|uniref:hypothetical protein n=1 Tax=Streptomyces albidoflavus TaxID=1886 RepID=UPI0033205BEF